MKNFKKLVAGIVTLVVGISVLAGCSNPVADELENFVNVQTVEVNAIYEEITAEAGTWESLESEEDVLKSVKDVLIPKTEEGLKLLNAVEVTTPEVQEIKAKYVKVFEAYKEGFGMMLTALENLDEAMMTESAAKLEEGITALNEYNAALKALAEENGLTIE